MVWRLKVGQQWVWVYLLPPAIPIVPYNGAVPWHAATDVADCYGPSLPGLEAYRARLPYHLVDEARLKLHPMPEVRNLAEALFRLERSRTPHDIAEVLRALGDVLHGAQMQPLCRTVNVWVRLLLLRKVPKANIAEIDQIHDLLEANAMLEQTIERWFEEATTKGLAKGMQQSMQQGLAKAVTLQLQLRFGPVPPWAQDRLASAGEDQLIEWAAAVLTASSLQDLFGAGDPLQ